MTTAVNFVLLVVIVLTLCVIPLWQSAPHGRGPDGGAVVMNPIVCGARWFFLSIVIAMCASRGAFSRGGAALLIGAYFVFEMVAAFTIAGQAFGLPEILSKATVLIPLGLPLPLVAYTFWWLNLRPENALTVAQGRWPAILASTAIAGLGIAAFVAGAMSGVAKAKDPAYQVEKEMRWYRTITALGDLEPVLRFMDPEEPAPVRALAAADLGNRQKLVEEWADVFTNGGVYPGVNAARYLKEMKPAAPPELGGPYGKFAARTLELILASGDASNIKTYASFAEAVVAGAEALHTRDVDEQLQQMRMLLARFPQQTAAAVASIDRFVTEQ